MIEDRGNCSKRDVKLSDNKIYQSKIPLHQAWMIQESKVQSEMKYKCEKCARSYIRKASLYNHKKYECNVIPQFKCKFCGKQFKRKGDMNRHVDLVHLKTKLNTPQTKHNCDKCSLSYSRLHNLYRHKRSCHASVKPQFICDYCGHTAKEKIHLSKHITSRHVK